MTKKQPNTILEQLAEEIKTVHDGAFDDSGARAILGAAIKALRPQVLLHMAGNGKATERAKRVAEATLGSVVVDVLPAA